jgi:hypothetical protein
MATTKAIRTGVHATPEEVTRVLALILRVEETADDYLEHLQAREALGIGITRTARQHGLPNVVGTYGLDVASGEFLAPA